MRKPDVEVEEVVCSETGKPMPKIPMWMAGIKVKFVCDEARQKSPPMAGLAEVEPLRRSIETDPIDDIKEIGAILDVEEEADIEDLDVEEEASDDYDA